MEYIEQAVLRSLVYSDIFDFPLSKEEIWKFLISNRKISKRSFDLALNKLTKSVITSEAKQSGENSKNKRLPQSFHSFAMTRDGYYCLNGREEIILKRQKNQKVISEKLQIAKKAASYLSHIPSVLFIGLSGGLSMGDAGPADDIDFFIISKEKTLFKTRLSILLLLQFLGLRRRRNGKNTANKICVNLLIDGTILSWEEKLRDLYVAHEILQLKPLFQRNDTYLKFINANSWINDFFSNANISEQEEVPKLNKNIGIGIKVLTNIIDFLLPETLNRLLQLSYMGKHIENEIVTNHVLMFHPNDYRVQTLKKMRLKLRQLGLLTKS